MRSGGRFGNWGFTGEDLEGTDPALENGGKGFRKRKRLAIRGSWINQWEATSRLDRLQSCIKIIGLRRV